MAETEAQEILEEMYQLEDELAGDFVPGDEGRMQWLLARHRELLNLLEDEGWG